MRTSFCLILFCIVTQTFAQNNDRPCEEKLHRANVNVARFFTIEAEKAFNEDNSRLAYLLAKAALQKDTANEKAAQLKEDVIPSLSSGWYKSISAPSLMSLFNTHYWNPNDRVFYFFSGKNERDSIATLHIISPENPDKRFSFANCFGSFQYKSSIHGFTKNGKYLYFYQKSAADTINLRLVDIENPTHSILFKDVLISSNLGDYDFITFFKRINQHQNQLQIASFDQPDKIIASYTDVHDYYTISNKTLFFYTEVKDKKGNLNIVNLDNPNQVSTFPGIYIYSFKLLSDKKLVFLAESSNGASLRTLHLIQLDQPDKKISIPDIHNNEYFYRNFSPDDKYLTFFTDVKDEKGTLHLMNLAKPKEHWTFKDSHSGVYTYQFSPDSKYLTFFSQKQGTVATLNIVKISEPSKIHAIQGVYIGDYNFAHKHENDVRFSKDDRFLNFFSDVNNEVGTLHLLKLENFEEIYSYKNVRMESESFSPDNIFFAFFSNTGQNWGTLHLLYLADNQFPRQILSAPNCYNYGIRHFKGYEFSTNSKYFTFYSDVSTKEEMGTLNVIKLESPFKIASYPDSYYEYKNVIFSSNNRYLLFSSKENKSRSLNLLDLDNGMKKNTFPNYHHNTAGFSKDLQLLVFQSADSLGNRIHIWNIPQEKEEAFYRFKKNIEYYTLSKDNRWLFIFTYNKVFKIFDLHLTPAKQRAYYDEMLKFTSDEKIYFDIK